MPENTLFSLHTECSPEEMLDPAQPEWVPLPGITITRLWNGKPARSVVGPQWSNSTEVQSAWSHTHIFFRFLCSFSSLYVAPELGAGGPIDELWEYDVAEAFLRPGGCEAYFEFEVSPLGQWLDVHILQPRIDVDFSWESGMAVNVVLDRESLIWSACLAIPFAPMLNSAPTAAPVACGDIWRANFFRAAAHPPNREYLCWRPTLTPESDFHVPAAFGTLLFTDSAGKA